MSTPLPGKQVEKTGVSMRTACSKSVAFCNAESKEGHYLLMTNPPARSLFVNGVERRFPGPLGAVVPLEAQSPLPGVLPPTSVDPAKYEGPAGSTCSVVRSVSRPSGRRASHPRPS